MKRECSLLLLTHLFPNPANPKLGTFFRNKALALKRVGCRVTVVAPVPAVPFPLGMHPRYRDRIVPLRTAEWEGMEIHYPRFVRPPGAWFRPWEGRSIHLACRSLIRQLHKRENFDAVIGGMLTNDGLAALLAGRDLGLPAYSYAIGSDIHTYPRSEPKVAALTRRVFRELEGVFAVGPNFAREIQDEYPEFREKVRCNPLGVDVNVFRPNAGGEGWRELGFSERLSVALYVGDLSRAKGVADWMEIVPRTADLPIGWVMVGKGELQDEIQARIKADAPGFERVRLFPYLDFTSLVQAYQHADFFFFPSHAEGSPTVLLEAIACGLPVLASDIPANHDAVEEGGNGWFFPVGDVQMAERGLRSFLGMADLVEFGSCSRELAVREFDSMCNASKLIQSIASKMAGQG
jgi:glycosyltransferase involved in cell wall biosynthesis